MLGTPIVSIITPVYNAVSYLGRAVASVKAQTLEDWELILVDDGSTDGSAKAIDRLALEERRIRPVHQVNSGPARARNVAVTHARGRYLAFMDSDDTVSPEWLERMVREADEREADMVMCNYRTVNASGLRRESHHGFTCGRVMSPEMLKEEVLMRYFRRASVGVPSLWTKLIRSEWLKKAGVTMPENRVRAEDWLFILRCLETDTPPYGFRPSMTYYMTIGKTKGVSCIRCARGNGGSTLRAVTSFFWSTSGTNSVVNVT